MNTSINFELAKLLKEKGFDNESAHYYNEKGEMLFDAYYPSLQPTKSDVYYDNPTIVEVVMWLYEKHGIWIVVWSDTNLNLPEWKNTAKWYYVINCDLINCYDEYGKLKSVYNTPTEAYLAAIEYTLNKLI